MPDHDQLPSRGLAAIIPAYIIETVAAVLVLSALAVIVGDVAGRWIAQSPLRWSQEVLEQTIPIIAFAGVAAAFAGAAMAIAWPPRSRAASPGRFWTWAGPLVGMAVFMAIAALFLERADQARETGDLTMTASLPLAPIFSTTAVLACLAVLVAGVAAVRALMSLAPLAPKDPELDI